jgi:hypothetical protein
VAYPSSGFSPLQSLTRSSVRRPKPTTSLSRGLFPHSATPAARATHSRGFHPPGLVASSRFPARLDALLPTRPPRYFSTGLAHGVLPSELHMRTIPRPFGPVSPPAVPSTLPSRDGFASASRACSRPRLRLRFANFFTCRGPGSPGILSSLGPSPSRNSGIASPRNPPPVLGKSHPFWVSLPVLQSVKEPGNRPGLFRGCLAPTRFSSSSRHPSITRKNNGCRTSRRPAFA